MPEGVNAALLAQAGELAQRYETQARHWQKFQFVGRMAVLALGLLTALLSGLAQVNDTLRAVVYWPTVATPALAAVLTAVLAYLNLTPRWVAYRTGAEGLKSELYLYAAGAEKYAWDDRDRVLERRLGEVEKVVADLLRPAAEGDA
jgi:hypothetical protein